MASRDEKIIKLLQGFDARMQRIEDRLAALEGDDDVLDDLLGANATEPQPAPDPNPVAKPRPVPDGRGVVDLSKLTPPDNWPQMTPEEREAWMRAHEGLSREPDPEPEMEVISIAGGQGVEFPAAPIELKAEWEQHAEAIFENWRPEPSKGWMIDKRHAAEAYTKGGPLWLAAYAHEYLMGLPGVWRAEMVQQVTSYAPRAGRDLGRDILRHGLDSADRWAYDDALEVADNRKDGLVRGKNTGA